MNLLAINWDFDPTLFTIFGFEIRWYSLTWVAALLFGGWLFTYFCKREGKPQQVSDTAFLYIALGTIIGARLGHCLFYEPAVYLAEPWKIITGIRDGGLASHGGTIALILAMIWFARHYGRKHDFDFLWIVDHLAIAVCFAATMIRLGNLFNSEIYGDVTNLPWGFIFERRGETEPKHPTQLYEAVSYLILGLVLLCLYVFRLGKTYRGTLIGLFFIGCFGMRFLIEFIKEPQVGFEEQMTLNMGQWLSIPFVLLGAGLLIYSFIKKQPAAVQHPKKDKPKPSTYAKSLA